MCHKGGYPYYKCPRWEEETKCKSFFMLIVGLANARNAKNLKRKSFFALFANKGGYSDDQGAQGGEKKQNAKPISC